MKNVLFAPQWFFDFNTLKTACFKSPRCFLSLLQNNWLAFNYEKIKT
jgi:predicted metal-binding membrane protein